MQDKEKHKLYMRRYYSNNKERLQEYTKMWARKKYGSKERVKIKFNKESQEKAVQTKRIKSKELYLQNLYNIGLEEYNTLFTEQGGCCAICGIHQSEIKRPLYVDHCHKTDKVRGLLCHKCNFAIGLFNDSVENLNKAIIYLK
jgi:hypothetical protein